MTGFTIEVDQNTYLPACVGRVDAIVTVQAPDTPVAAPPAGPPRKRSRRCATGSRSP